MVRDIKVYQISRWGCPKKERGLPAFLLPKPDKETMRYQKGHLTGRPRKLRSNGYCTIEK